MSTEDKKRKSKSRERSTSKGPIENAKGADSKDQKDGDNVKGRQRSKSREKKKKGKESGRCSTLPSPSQLVGSNIGCKLYGDASPR